MSAISDKRKALEEGFPPFLLGAPTTAELSGPDGGAYQVFENATIFWSPSTNAHEVHGYILERYVELGGPKGMLGYPISDETTTPSTRGKFNQFQHASLYWYRYGDMASDGAYVVQRTPKPCTASPPESGQWEIPAYGSGVVGAHAALMRHGKVLFFTYLEPPGIKLNSLPERYGDSAVLDLRTGFISHPPYTGAGGTEMENLFCSGHAFLEDGRLLVAGGERNGAGVRAETVRAIHIFTPGGVGGGQWQQVGNCARGRWYPQCVTLPDGKVLVLGGTTEAVTNWTYEVFDPKTNSLEPERLAPTEIIPWLVYPLLFVLPSNKVFVHAGTQTRLLDISSRTFESVVFEAAARPERNARTYPHEGTAVLLPLLPSSVPPYRARVMLIGGGAPKPLKTQTPATNTCEIIDLSATAPEWKLVAPMQERRVMPDAVLLPDGTVFVCNGSRAGMADRAADPVYQAEIYDPQADSWTTVCHMTIPRLYHATALLLPDGRVMSAGTDSVWNPVPFDKAELRVEIFSPPYLFHGPRPSIADAPVCVDYDEEFDVDFLAGGPVARVVILRCGSVTHSFNADQRHVGLAVIAQTVTTIRVAAPPDSAIAPPGFYLLFLVSELGVPSIGRYVRLTSEPCLRTRPFPYDTKDTKLGKLESKESSKDLLLDLTKPPGETLPLEPPGVVRDLFTRIEALEHRLHMVDAFIQPHERPNVGSHGGMGMSGAPMPAGMSMPGEPAVISAASKSHQISPTTGGKERDSEPNAPAPEQGHSPADDLPKPAR
jgi:hypothetical protein